METNFDVMRRRHMRYATGKWMHCKLDFYAMCKEKYEDLTDADIAYIMGIPESSVVELSLMVALNDDEEDE